MLLNFSGLCPFSVQYTARLCVKSIRSQHKINGLGVSNLFLRRLFNAKPPDRPLAGVYGESRFKGL
jgi:hypothetical protein